MDIFERVMRAGGFAVAISAMLVMPGIAQQLGQVPGLRTQLAAVVDAQGFGQPVPAARIMIPAGWSTKGGVIWTPQDSCNPYGYNYEWQAGSPDETQGVFLLPMVRWVEQADGRGCPQKSIRDARGLLQWITEAVLPQARIIDYRARPDLVQEANLRGGRTDYGYGMSMTTTVDAGEVLIAFQDKGREMRASIAVAMMSWVSEMQGSYGMPGIRVAGGSSLPGFGAVAPDGQLDLRTVELIRRSITPDPEWSRRIAQHHRVIDRQNAKGAMDRSRIVSRTNSEISDIIHQGYQNRLNIRARGDREASEYYGGYETYNDPTTGGTIELDSGYRNAWQMNDGTFILTDDDNFNPADLNMLGQRLDVTQ
ncbi:hypothetical protein ACFORG_07955 [Lutimaribacter marinistellae]|uniref:Uncharacterized protein n=1 Tax=Lutimaribacter marinistellae TaxID=1820329 RepID=A0ABV7TH02_9RHOB